VLQLARDQSAVTGTGAATITQAVFGWEPGLLGVGDERRKLPPSVTNTTSNQ
jgi:hypothetical protein